MLVTEVRYPMARPERSVAETAGGTPATRVGGFPMIVFAHGYDVMPSTYAALLDVWVRKGYVVAAPIFPDENRVEVGRQHNANTEYDLWNEPADLAFVTHQLLDASRAATATCPQVAGLIRPSALSLAGHSDGGTVGEFNRSLQHLQRGGSDGTTVRVGEGVFGSRGVEVARSAVA